MAGMRIPMAGELRELITVKQWQDMPDATTGLDKTYSEPLQLWAKIEPVGAAIYHGTQQTGNAITHRFYIRYLAATGSPERYAVSVDNVIEHQGIRYRIKRVTDLNSVRRFLILEAEELGIIN